MTTDAINLVCPSCRSLLTIDNSSITYLCSSCKTVFPIIENLPLLVVKPEYYVARIYYEYYNHLSKQHEIIKKLDNALDGPRGKVIKKVLYGIEHNQNFFEKLSAVFEKIVNPKALLDVAKTSSTVSYSTNLDYVFKDWVPTDNIAEKIKQVSSLINDSLYKLNKAYESALYLGAGTCRLGLELRLLTNDLWCVDYSYTMGYFYKQLTTNDLSFYQISLKNNYKVSQMAKKIDINVSYYQEVKTQSSHLNYVIADALQMPFSSARFDLVLSIYFTDVVPIKKLICEVKRVLKPGGIFLHFGPLDYHTENIEEMFSYEELVAILEEEGFKIELEDDMVTDNNSNMGELCRKEYTNKLLIAKYLGRELTVSLESVYSLKKDIFFKIEGRIGKSYSMQMESWGYSFDQETADASFELLKRLDGKITLIDIITELKFNFELSTNFENQATHLMKILLEKGIIEKAS